MKVPTSMLKHALTKLLIRCLSYLVPLEDVIGHAVQNAAVKKVAEEVRAASEAADRVLDNAFHDLLVANTQAKALHAKRLALIKAAPHVVTPEGAAGLVAAAAVSATVTPQG